MEFSLDPTTCFKGIKIGRLYLKSQLWSEINQLINPCKVIETRNYADDQTVVWFLSSLVEYRRLAELYPQSDEFLRKTTQKLLEG